jgi:hypothetical protein
MSIKYISDSDLESVVGGGAPFPVPQGSIGWGSGGLPGGYNAFLDATGQPPTKIDITNPFGTVISLPIPSGVVNAAGNVA